MSRTVKVRVPLMMNAAGMWGAYGWNSVEDGEARRTLRDMMGSEDTTGARVYYITADVPVPEPVEIAATVEGEADA